MDRPARVAVVTDTAYHSFNDIELLEPPSVPSPPASRGSAESVPPPKMQRQDSGYESHGPSPRPSASHPRPPASKASSGPGSPSRIRSRPSTHRSAKSFPQLSPPLLYQDPSSRPHGSRPPSAAYFQFPTPDLVELAETPLARHDTDDDHAAAARQPPQTTHYWTSDRTRRLEYAAIDAAGRGVKGWVRRHLVPACFGPRHVAFDDDSGSVRRYRLELEDDHDEKSLGPVPAPRRRSWQIWPLLRKSKTL